MIICISFCIAQAAWSNSWRGHESGKHAGVRNHPQEIIGMLMEVGWSCYEKWSIQLHIFS